VRSFGKFLEIVERFNLVLVALGKGSCRVRSLGKFFEGSIFFWGGSNPGKRESGDLRLLWDYFWVFF